MPSIPVFANPRMGVEMHVTGLQSGMALWALGLMWQRLALSAGAERPAQILAVAGLYAIFISLLLAALWGTSRATPIAGAGHQASILREAVGVTVLLTGGSLATVAAVAMVLWGLCARKDWRGHRTLNPAFYPQYGSQLAPSSKQLVVAGHHRA
jgi:hydroxylaminobenzene mutase